LSFLRHRSARINDADKEGEWIKSEFGTLAGTSLGPILFIVHTHDVPKRIIPKFADDLVAVKVDSDIGHITYCLQDATDQLVQWAETEGMQINAEKTKVIVFGHSSEEYHVKVNGKELENVQYYKYLGVILNPQLSFTIQVDYSVSTAKRDPPVRSIHSFMVERAYQ